MLRPRIFRPFPYAELADALSNVKAVAVMDRADSTGAEGGPLFMEFKSALYNNKKQPLMINKIFGLGGRDLMLPDIEMVYRELRDTKNTGKIRTISEYITVRGEEAAYGKALGSNTKRAYNGRRAQDVPWLPRPIIVNLILRTSDAPVVLANATGCLEVASTIFPYTAWRAPWMHSAFENAAATASGIETMYRALRKKGKINKKINFVAFGGDGGTYDIGFQSLSGALERGHRFLYVCYDNGAYMNTGVQRSSSTPFGAATTTSPAGLVIQGKLQKRKDLTKIVVAHNIPYVAQASPHNWLDLTKKAEKAFAVDGPSFLNVVSPCPLAGSRGKGYNRIVKDCC